MIEIIPEQMQYYIKQRQKRLGAFSVEQLYKQHLTPNTLIWFQGQQGWKKLKDIPELTPLYKSLPPKPNNRYAKIWWAASVLSILILIGTIYYLYFYLPRKAKELKPLTTEQLYEKYAKSVVLIKHAFLYKIHIGSEDYYFKEYNPVTGSVPNFSANYDSLKQDPNISWGTGFFIDNKGNILTCNHLIDVAPSKNDQEKILNSLREEASNSLIEMYQTKNDIERRLDNLNYLLTNAANLMSEYDYIQKTLQRDNCIKILDELDYKITSREAIVQLVFSNNNIVTKTSLQFGIFLNDTISNTLNDYIKCDVVKRSEDENTDLALIQTRDKTLPNKNIIPLNFGRIKQGDTMTVRLTEPVRMIGYNYGIIIAKTSSGIKSQITEGAISQNSDADKLLYTIPALPGSSGSPVFDQYGQVVSVNFAGAKNSQNFNYGIQPKKIKAFLGLNK